MDPESNTTPSLSNETPLQGWKEIGAYLEREPRTARRWELEEELPIRRHRTDRRSSVYAYPSELESWRASRPAQSAVDEGPVASKLRFWLWGAAAAVAAVILSTLILNPPNPLVDAAGRSGSMVTRQVWTGQGVDDWGDVSPDGRFIAYINWECGDLMLRNLGTEEERLLHADGCYKNGYAYAARFSPDGKEVAYLWEDYADASNASLQIRVLALGPDGQPGETRTAIEGDEIQLRQWSNDGKSFLLNTGMSDATRIALASVDTGEIRPIKTVEWGNPNPILSPDGRFIAYDVQQEQGMENRDIHVVAADGSFESLLVEHPANDAVVAWDAGGESLFFVSDREGPTNLYKMRLKNGRPSGQPVTVKHSVGSMKAMRLTGDGSLFYSVPLGAREVSIADLSRIHDVGYTPERLRSQLPGGQQNPAFAPNGRLLAYLTDPPLTAPGAPPETRLVIRDLDTGNERVFSQDQTQLRIAGTYTFNFFSPDSRWLLVNAYSLVRNRRVIAAVNVGDGSVKVIRAMGSEDGLMYPSGWIDDRTVLIRNQVNREENGEYEFRSVLISLDVQSGESRDIFMRGRLASAGATTPDRKFVVFPEAPRQERGRQLTVIPIAGGEPRTLLPLDDSWGVVQVQGVSADGEDVYFTHKVEELWRVPIVGGEPEPVGLKPRERSLQQVALHRDGRRIAYQAGEARREIWVLENFLNEQ